MSAITFEDLKVKGACLLGMGSPVMNVFLREAESWLKVGVLIGQIAVAAVTFFYIHRKMKNIKEEKKKDDGDL